MLEIIEFLEKYGGPEAISLEKKQDVGIFEKLPRYEDYQTEEEFDKAVDKYFLDDEISVDNIFNCNKNQRTFSPLLDNEEGLVINSIVI